jgi:hypothetical protein
VPKFTDGAKREWEIAIDVPLVKRIASDTGVRIERLLTNNGAGLVELLTDPVEFIRVLWILCEEKAEKLAIQPEQFARAFYGDPLEDATIAFQEALADFCPRRQRSVLKALTAKSTEVAELQTAAALKEVAETDAAKVVEDLVTRAKAAQGATSSSAATNSPASLVLTPIPEG